MMKIHNEWEVRKKNKVTRKEGVRNEGKKTKSHGGSVK
jgi:hypothetical protein